MGVVTLAALAALLVLGAAPAQAQEDGVGKASARGTDPGIWPGSGGQNVTVQYSAITNCDETQSTGPFYVRWTVDTTTFTFKQTGAADTSSCFSVGGINGNEGHATGMLLNDGSQGQLFWNFRDNFFGPGADDVIITVITGSGIADSGILAVTGGEPEPLNGTPGGVWVFGELPWPAL